MIDFHTQLSIIPAVYETATLQDNLEHSGGITLSWKAKTDDEIPVGSFITYGGIRYILLDQYAPTRESKIHYQYNPTFKHPTNLLDRVPFWIKMKDAQGQDLNLRTTSFTGLPHTIAQKLCDFMAEYANETGDEFFAETVGLKLTHEGQDWDAETNPWKVTWTFNIPLENDKAIITVPFDGSSIKGAANAIADAMACNVFWDWNTKKLMFTAGTTITGETYNCFHVLGGTTNMGKTTTSGGYAAVTQRLTLADPVAGQDTFVINGRTYRILKGSIISGAGDGMRMTKDLILDDVYPKMELYINTARQRLCRLTDENGNFIVDHFEKNGQTVSPETEGATPIYKKFAKWYVTFKYSDGTPYVFDPEKLINDKALGLLFQIDFETAANTSPLAGRQFDLTYFPAAKTEWDKNDDTDSQHPFQILAGEFYIAFTAEGEQILPGMNTEGMYPKVGDKVTLVNVALTSEEEIAKTELLDSAKEIIGLMTSPSGEYTETMFFSDPASRVNIGSESPFDKTKHGPIVTSINHNLDTDVAEVTVGAWSRKTKTGGTADKLETVTVSANAATTGGDKVGSGDLGSGYYGQKENDTITETQIKPDTLFTAQLSIPTTSVDCTWDGKVKAATDLYTRVWAYYGTRNLTDICNITLKTALVSGISVHRETSASGTSGSAMVVNSAENLSDDKYWLRIHINKDVDFTDFSDMLNIAFAVNHQYHGDRDVTFGVSANRDGADGKDGQFQSRVFARINTDIKTAQPTGGTYNAPWPGGTNPCTQTYTIDGQSVNVTWHDGVPQGKEILWSTIRTFYGDNTQSSWSKPSQESDSATLDIEFSPNATQPSDPVGTAANKDTAEIIAQRQAQGWYDPNRLPSGQDMIWRAERKIANGVYDGSWTISRIKGEKGTSVKSVTCAYAKQTAQQYNGQPPTSGWQDTIAALGTIGEGDYLWTRMTTTFSDTLSDTVTYTVARWGIDGDGIYNIETKFYEDANLLTQAQLASLPENSWKDTYSGLALNQGDYIYTRVKIIYDKGDTPTVSYTVNRLGEDGVSYVSTEEYYCLGTSTTTPPAKNPYTRNDGKPETMTPATMASRMVGGEWSESRPDYDTSTAASRAKKYLWNFEVGYDTTTNVQVTQPICIANYEKGIASIVETYAISAQDKAPSGSSYPTDISSWTDEAHDCAPTDEKPYQWNKTVTTYTDGSVDTFYHVSAVKGTRGSKGGNTATVMLYRRGVENTSYTKPQITTYYKFSDKKLYKDAACTQEATSSDLNGWSMSVPSTTAKEVVYVTSAIAFSATDTDDIGSNEWVSPVQLTENGINSATVFLYKRSATAVTAHGITATLYYKFADGELYTTAACTTKATTQLNGWQLEIPASDGNPCYVIQAAALNSLTYDPIDTTDWSGVRKMVEDGKRGDFKSTVFKRYATAPSTPTGGSYDSPVPSGWSDGVPDGDAILWASACTFHGDGTNSGWSAPKQMTDTADFDVEFSSVANPNPPSGHPNTNTQWSNTSDSTTIWMATSECHNGVWSAWQVSKIKGEKGQDADVWTIGSDGYWYKNGVKQDTKAEGKDGTGVEIKGGVNSYNALQNVTAEYGDCWIVNDATDAVHDGHLYFYQGGTWPNNWRDLGKIKGESGEDGKTYYTHFAYADTINLSANPITGTGFSVDSNGNYAWMGLCVDENQYDPGSPLRPVSNPYEYYEWNKVEGKEGTSPWFADLDNEMDSIACDLNGHPSSAQSVQTKVSMWHGSQKQSCTIRVYDDNTSGYAYSNGSAHNGITISWSDGNNGTGLVTVAFASGNTVTINGKKVFCIQMTSSTEVKVVYLTVNGVRPGAKGQNAILYSLLPSESSVVKKGSSYSVSTISCTRMKNDGGSISETTDGSIWYTIDNSQTERSYTNNTPITVDNFTTCIKFIFKNANGTVVDRETIPMVSDGDKGDSGRWYEYYGDVTNSDVDLMNTANHGWFVKKGSYFHMLIADDGVTVNTYTCPSDTSSVTDEWEYMGGDRKYYIAEAMFAEQAYFGKFVIKGNWMISTDGGPTGKTYSDFNGSLFLQYLNGTLPEGTTYNGFIPNYAVDGQTGAVYEQNAHVSGDFETLDGFIKMTSRSSRHGNTAVFTMGIPDPGYPYLIEMMASTPPNRHGSIQVSNASGSNKVKILDDAIAFTGNGDIRMDDGDISGADHIECTSIFCSSSIEAERLDVDSFIIDRYSPASGVNNYRIGRDGYTVEQLGTWSGSSDIRLKNVIKDIDLALEAIAEAPIFCFSWKADKNNMPHVGTAAQYWEKALPESVVKDSEGMLAMDYGATALASAVAAAKKIRSQEQRIVTLEAKVKRLEALVEELLNKGKSFMDED